MYSEVFKKFRKLERTSVKKDGLGLEKKVLASETCGNMGLGGRCNGLEKRRKIQTDRKKLPSSHIGPRLPTNSGPKIFPKKEISEPFEDESLDEFDFSNNFSSMECVMDFGSVCGGKSINKQNVFLQPDFLASSKKRDSMLRQKKQPCNRLIGNLTMKPSVLPFNGKVLGKKRDNLDISDATSKNTAQLLKANIKKSTHSVFEKFLFAPHAPQNLSTYTARTRNRSCTDYLLNDTVLSNTSGKGQHLVEGLKFPGDSPRRNSFNRTQ